MERAVLALEFANCFVALNGLFKLTGKGASLKIDTVGRGKSNDISIGDML